MGCCNQLHDYCWKLYKDRKDKESNSFSKMKEGFTSSMDNIKTTMQNIEDWEELLNPIDDSEEENINEQQSNEQKDSNIKGCYILSFIIGLFFCLINFIGVQIGLIVINAIFKEIIDELKLWLNKIPRHYNFYENIEIAAYKSVPEIDVGMFFSFLGLITLKKCEFIISNLIFHFLSMGCFIILFLLFDFHTGDELLSNYTKMETTILIVFYILLCIFIGASSFISLKEFFNVYKVYYRNNLFKKKETDINEEEKERKKIFEINDDFIEKIVFFIFSTLSALSVVGICRIIFVNIKIEENKKILHAFLVIYAGIIVLSLISYLYYSIPKLKRNCEIINEYSANQGKEMSNEDSQVAINVG